MNNPSNFNTKKSKLQGFCSGCKISSIQEHAGPVGFRRPPPAELQRVDRPAPGGLPVHGAPGGGQVWQLHQPGRRRHAATETGHLDSRRLRNIISNICRRDVTAISDIFLRDVTAISDNCPTGYLLANHQVWPGDLGAETQASEGK